MAPSSQLECSGEAGRPTLGQWAGVTRPQHGSDYRAAHRMLG